MIRSVNSCCTFIQEEQEIQTLINEMDEARIENLKKVRAELEVCYEKERQEILSNLKTELDERKRELLELRNQEMGKLENEHERDLGEEKLAKQSEYELRKQHNEKVEAIKKELEKELDELRNELRAEQREKITKFTKDHDQCLTDMLRDFRLDVSIQSESINVLSHSWDRNFAIKIFKLPQFTSHFRRRSLARCTKNDWRRSARTLRATPRRRRRSRPSGLFSKTTLTLRRCAARSGCCRRSTRRSRKSI